MQTKIMVDEAVLRRVRRYASDRSLGLGRAIAELLERGLDQCTEAPADWKVKLQPFRLPADSPVVTSAQVRALE